MTTEITGNSSSFSSLLALIRADWECNQRDWTQPGFRAAAVYRLGRWQMELRGRSVGVRVLRRATRIVHRILYRFVRNHYGIDLPATARIGRRLRIVHLGGIVIHRKAVIGDDCVLRQGVTVGAAADYSAEEAPRIGNGVEIGAGAIILGPVNVGDGARVGPGAVVLRDVPAGATAFADPARMMYLPTTDDSATGQSEQDDPGSDA